MGPLPVLNEGFLLRLAPEKVQSVAHDVASEQQLLLRAAEHVRAGAHAEAEGLYRQLLDAGSANPQILVNLSVICALTQRPEEQLHCLERALQLDPAFSPAWFNRGMALVAQRRYDAALVSFENSLQAERAQPMALAGCGLCHGMLGRIDAALANYHKAVERGLDEPGQSFFQLGRELYRNQRFPEAIQILRAGLEAHGDHADSLLILACSFVDSGCNQEAVEVFLYLLSIDPHNQEALSCYGALLMDTDQLAEAEDLLTRAIAADPARPEPHNLLGLLHQKAGRMEQATGEFDRALQLAPKLTAPRLNLATALRQQGDLEACLESLNLIFADYPDDIPVFYGLMLNLSLGGERHAPRMLSTGQQWWARYRHTHGLTQPALTPGAGPPIRVGILSSHFHGHSVSRFLLSYLDHHNRDQVRIEAIPTKPLLPAVEAGLRKRVAEVLAIANLPDPEARRRIRARRYDLILDTHAYEEGSGLQLLSERCAPVQCHYIGFQATLALDTIDYFIGDRETAGADLQEQFRERLWRLPRPWLACTPATSIPIAASTRSGQARIVLGSFNQIGKVRDDTLRHWARALHAVPESVLLIKNKWATGAGIQARITGFLAGEGIAPDRLDFREWESDPLQHLLAYNDIDIALDATPWSSATTGFDALSMGVPLVAIRGQCLAARMGSSLVKGIGRPEWVAASPEEFAAIVARLAAEVEPLRAQRAALQQEVLNGPLYDPADLAHHLDQALLAMVQLRREQG
jgi:predicted O-linked N-acetylglucosamine transferase (SPINDLY family)